MTQGSHTKGPWTVHTSRTTDDVGIIGDNGCLAECFSEIRKQGEKAFTEQMANARLIAAAPDLLEALIHARQNMPHPDQIIDDAIAKARGQGQ